MIKPFGDQISSIFAFRLFYSCGHSDTGPQAQETSGISQGISRPTLPRSFSQKFFLCYSTNIIAARSQCS